MGTADLLRAPRRGIASYRREPFAYGRFLHDVYRKGTGMRLTGGFALALATDAPVLAPFLVQPSLFFVEPRRRRRQPRGVRRVLRERRATHAALAPVLDVSARA
jgi:hypothetical protein